MSLTSAKKNKQTRKNTLLNFFKEKLREKFDYAFEQYKKARIAFIVSVADLASRPQNIEFLNKYGTIDLIRPLMNDTVSSIQQTSAVALGRLGNHNEQMARDIIEKNILPDLLRNLDQQNICFKKAAMFALRAICKHSPQTAQGVVQAGGIQAMICGLKDYDPGIKESSAWAVGYIARHNETLAQSVVDAGAVPLLMVCLRDKRLCLKQIGASALCDIAKHSFLLAQNIADSGIIRIMSKLLDHPDVKLKRAILATVANVARQSVDLAEHIVECEVLPEVFLHMRHPDDLVQRNSASVLREVTKHSLQLAQIVVNLGGIASLLDLISNSKTDSRVPAILSLGYISLHSQYIAMAVIESKGVEYLSVILHSEEAQHVLAPTAWALGQIGRHSPEHSLSLFTAKVFTRLVELYKDKSNTNDLRVKCKDALKVTLQMCTELEALEPLLFDVPPIILKYVLRQYSKILPNDLKSRCQFVASGCLKKLQEIQSQPGSKLAEYITIINCCFPEDIVRYYSPGYPEMFKQLLDTYVPQLPSLYAITTDTDFGNESEAALLAHDEESGKKK